MRSKLLVVIFTQPLLASSQAGMIVSGALFGASIIGMIVSAVVIPSLFESSLRGGAADVAIQRNIWIATLRSR